MLVHSFICSPPRAHPFPPRVHSFPHCKPHLCERRADGPPTPYSLSPSHTPLQQQDLSQETTELQEVRARSGADMKRDLTWWDLAWFGSAPSSASGSSCSRVGRPRRTSVLPSSSPTSSPAPPACSPSRGVSESLVGPSGGAGFFRAFFFF